MEEYKVLITTSGLGTRLGELTNYTNKSLIRIGKKPAISYIVEQYPDNIELVITLGHFGNHVKEFLVLTYPNKLFKFVDIEMYSGVGSSLGYSMLQAENHLQCPFIFHASDSIVSEEIPIPNKNWIGYSINNESSQYRTIELNGSLKIYEKGELNSNAIYIGISGIYDYKNFWENLKNEYNKLPNDSSLSDCHAISKMFDKEWEIHEFKSWMDIGNSTSLKNARENIKDKFNILDKNDESIFIFDDFVIKFFYDSTICLNRVERAKLLDGLVPDIIGSGNNFYKYKLFKGEVFSHVVNEKIFFNFLNWSKHNLWIKKGVCNKLYLKCILFYFQKTQSRIDKFLSINNITDEHQKINGVNIPPISDMLTTIGSYLNTDISYQIHGDYILDNIIYNNDEFKLIDWRQDFGGDIENGDIYYDLAKLNHSLLFNHDIVNDGHYSIKKTEDGIICDILRSDNLTNCREILHKFIVDNNFDIKKVNIITALIWINMSPLHDVKLGNFLFYFGKYNLFKSLCK